MSGQAPRLITAKRYNHAMTTGFVETCVQTVEGSARAALKFRAESRTPASF